MELGNCVTEEFAMHGSCIVKSTTSSTFLAVCFIFHHEYGCCDCLPCLYDALTLILITINISNILFALFL